MLDKVKNFFSYVGTVTALYWYALTGGKFFEVPDQDPKNPEEKDDNE